MLDVDAVVLVGGRGTRLRPLTLSTPKPMLPMAGVPFLSHLLSRLKSAGIQHVVLGTSYRAEVFEAYFGDGSEFGMELEYVFEQQPLDTAGAIRNVADRLRADNVVVCNGDILSGTDIGALVDSHRNSRAEVTLQLQRVAEPGRFGCVPTDADGRVLQFLEKTPDPPTDQVNAGCYVFTRERVAEIPADRPVSVERETFPELLAAGAHLHGFVDGSYWLDVGTPESYVRGSADVVRGIAPSDALPGPGGEYLALPSASCAATTELTGGTTLGQRVHVGAGTGVHGSVVLDDVSVGPGSEVTDSVLGAGSRVGSGTVLRGVVLADGASVGDGCELLHGARVWPDVGVPDGGIRFSSDL